MGYFLKKENGKSNHGETNYCVLYMAVVMDTLPSFNKVIFKI